MGVKRHHARVGSVRERLTNIKGLIPKMQATVVRGLLIAIVVLFLGFQSKNIHSIVASAKKAVKARPIVFAYVAQVTANSCFGIGSVVGKLGLPSVNPLMFVSLPIPPPFFSAFFSVPY